MKSEYEMKQIVEQYSDMIRKICFVHLKNRHDTEDVLQNVFLKYLLHKDAFESEEHQKAWFIRVTMNACTDWIRALNRHSWVPLDVIQEEAASFQEEDRTLLECVLKLPDKYKDVVYLYYYEEYSAVEIAKILGKKENTIYTWLSRAREIIRKEIGGEWCE